MQHARQIPEFDVIWQVQTGARAVAERTPFERLEVVPQTEVYPSVAYGFGPYWWYDPFYASFSFSHPVIIHHHPGHFGGPRHVWVGGHHHF